MKKRIIIELNENGDIDISYDGLEPLQVLGLLELVKHKIIESGTPENKTEEL